jgi:hypothetical protein
MNRPTARKLPTAALSVLLCLAPAAARAQKKLKKSDAQKLVAALSLLELNKGAVVVKEITPTGSGANVLAGVKVAVRFERGEGGAWRAAAVRTGDRQWEEFDLLAPAAGPARVARARAALDSLAAELESLAGAKDKGSGQLGGAGEEKEGGRGRGKAEDGGKAQPARPQEPELVRGAER